MRERGRWAELLAAEFLRKRGLRLLVRNYQCRSGEIDLIMCQQLTLVFVEVRYRANPHYGQAIETVNARKRERIVKTAQYYLQSHRRLSVRSCRFDVVTVRGNLDGPEIDWIQNAFSA